MAGFFMKLLFDTSTQGLIQVNKSLYSGKLVGDLGQLRIQQRLLGNQNLQISCIAMLHEQTRTLFSS